MLLIILGKVPIVYIFIIKIIGSVLGDLNGDGVVSSVDYLRIKQNFNGNLTLSQTEEKAADIDSDGRITSTDYLKVKKHMAGTVNLYD